MKYDTWLFLAAITAAASTSAFATEPGGPAAQAKPGILIGASAGVPAPGVYMFDQVFTYQANITGPVTKTMGTNTHLSMVVNAEGFLFVPGWTILGATYDAVVVQPFVMSSVNSPLNTQSVGVHNTYLVPVELSWKFADTGFFLKAGLGIWAPTGSTSGPAGLSNVGSPYWTFQPELIASYLKDGWNLSAAIYEEFNTANSVTNYQTGNILHADFTATKTIGKWTFGPAAYYYGQVSSDKSSAFYGNALGTQRFDVWAVGGVIGYDFGPANLKIWATHDVSNRAYGATIAGTRDPSSVAGGGFTVLASLSYRLWAPEEATPAKRSAFFK